jgi:hypothetical protein
VQALKVFSVVRADPASLLTPQIEHLPCSKKTQKATRSQTFLVEIPQEDVMCSKECYALQNKGSLVQLTCSLPYAFEII